jgi:tRNA A-37 threonylcarbamoyl transferase component Bud32
MNCFKCNAPLDPGVRFCGGCGSQQPGVPPQSAVRTHSKTLFQGSGTAVPVKSNAINPTSAPSTSSPPRAPGEFTGNRTSGIGYAQTIAPGSLEIAAILKAANPETNRPMVESAPAAPSPPMGGDLSGRTLNNRYLVEKKIGEGGFGAVYRARQTQMNRVVALKVLHTKMASDTQVIGRFKREAQASSLLRAAHTVQVYDFDQTPEGIMYLAMEMLEGRSLHATLADERLDPVRVAKIMDGIASSLEEAHKQGIVHRDIKPENIFLEPRPTADFVKVLDFGIAKIVSGDGLASAGPALTAAGQTLGTLEYMSPEQLMGAQLDGRSDLYALGILAYEMLVGELPFPSKTPGELITAHLKTMPPPPSTIAPDLQIPPLLDQIILKLIQKDRDQRFRDTTELRAELAKVIGGKSTEEHAAVSASMAATIPLSLPVAPEKSINAAARAKPRTTFMLAVLGLVLALLAVAGVLILKK